MLKAGAAARLFCLALVSHQLQTLAVYQHYSELKPDGPGPLRRFLHVSATHLAHQLEQLRLQLGDQPLHIALVGDSTIREMASYLCTAST